MFDKLDLLGVGAALEDEKDRFHGGRFGGSPGSAWPAEQGAPYILADGTFPGAVTRTNDLRPLSHQNDTRYVLNPALSDDFATFDTAKWFSLPSGAGGEALGRIPARYWGNNITIVDGELNIRMHEVNPAQTDPLADDYDPAITMDPPTSYGGWTSGNVQTIDFVLYGYFEIYAKIMPSEGSSAFWLAWPADADVQTEIDVFEMGGDGNTPDPAGDELPHLTSNNRFNMNYHVFESAEHPEVVGYNQDRCWVAPFEFKDAYHTYGLQWDAEYVRWYVDGVLIHVKANIDHHVPMKIILDSEAFWGGEADGGWFGFPTPAKFPSYFKIQWLRTWTKTPG